MSDGRARIRSSRPERLILVLGCGGFIGRHLVERLLEAGTDQVEGWDTDGRHLAGLVDRPNFTFEHRSITDSQRLGAAIENADVVINLVGLCRPAAYVSNPLAVIQTNLLDLVPVIERCAGSGTWLIHFSTSEVYGRTLSSFVPEVEDPLGQFYVLRERDSPMILGPATVQRWSYGASKQLAERLIHAHHLDSGLEFTVLRPFNVVGPGLDLGAEHDGPIRVLSAFVNATVANRPLYLVDGGVARRCLTSIHDAVDLVVALLDRPDRAKGAILNVGNPANEISIAALARRVVDVHAALTDQPSHRVHEVRSVSGVAFYGPGYEDIDRRVPDIALAGELVGWVPWRSIDQIVQEAVSSALAMTSGVVVRDAVGRGDPPVG